MVGLKDHSLDLLRNINPFIVNTIDKFALELYLDWIKKPVIIWRNVF